MNFTLNTPLEDSTMENIIPNNENNQIKNDFGNEAEKTNTHINEIKDDEGNNTEKKTENKKSQEDSQKFESSGKSDYELYMEFEKEGKITIVKDEKKKEKKINSLKNEISNMKSKNKKLEEKNKEFEEKINILNKEKDEIEVNVNSKTGEKNINNEDIIQKYKDNFEKNQKEIIKLKDEIDKFKNKENQKSTNENDTRNNFLSSVITPNSSFLSKIEIAKLSEAQKITELKNKRREEKNNKILKTEREKIKKTKKNEENINEKIIKIKQIEHKKESELINESKIKLKNNSNNTYNKKIYEEEDKIFEEKIKELKENLNKLEKNQENKTNDFKNKEIELTNFKSQINTLSEGNEKLNKELNLKNDEVTFLKNEKVKLENKIKESQIQNKQNSENSQIVINDLNTKILKLKEELEKIKTNNEEIQKLNQDNKKKVFNCNAIHHGIKCCNCGVEPIKGFRFKCPICNNYNLCEECEEKNYKMNLHEHDFIKMKNEEIIPQKKEEINKIKLNNKDNNIDSDSSFSNSKYNIFNSNVNNIEYSYKLINKNYDSKLQIYELELENDGNIVWPNYQTTLKCDKDNTTISCDENILLKSQGVGQKNTYKIDFNSNKNLEPGVYKAVYYFVVDGKKYGDKLEMDIIIESEITRLIKILRAQFQLSEKDYSDERIKAALEDNDNKIEHAFMSLIGNE